jgi:antitoxin CptB
MQEMPDTLSIARLKWACRRGMLELDILLENFLNEAYSSLSAEDKEHFAALLATPDPELFSFLMGKEVPADINLAHMVEVIRHHAKSRI